MHNQSAQLKHRSLSQRLVAQLSEQIRDGVIKCGDKLPTESEIMQENGISRTVVREAISRLQASGLVVTRHGIGTFVLDTPITTGLRIDPAMIGTLVDVLSLLELRISLEVESAGLAALRRSPDQLAAMRLSLDRLEQCEAHSSEAASEDFEFHLQIAGAMGNHYVTEIMQHLGTASIPRSRLNSARLAHEDPRRYQARLRREHEQIYEAIARQDAESARAAMRLHLSNSRERLRNAYEEAEAQAAVGLVPDQQFDELA